MISAGRRVVVTGMGTVSPLGHDVEKLFSRLYAGDSGIEAITHFDAEGSPSTIGGVVNDFNIRDFVTDRATLRNTRLMDTVQQWAMAASVAAMDAAGLEDSLLAGTDKARAYDSTRVGVMLGTGLAGRGELFSQSNKMLQVLRDKERLAELASLSDTLALRAMSDQFMDQTNPMSFIQQCPSVATAYIAMRYQAQGPNSTVVSLCSAGAQAIGEATWMISRGDADCMLAGGSDSMLNRLDLTAFARMDAVSARNEEVTGACKPFDLRRDGCVVGEGAAMLVLESLDSALARGAPILAEVKGYATTSDAYKISAPPEDGSGAYQAMKVALERANLQATDIDYINAHGTSTRLNDRIETIGIKRLFAEHAYNIPISSTKSMTGHLIAAAGALEAIISIQALRHQQVPPTINLTHPDPQCDLDYVPNQGRDAALKHVLSNSFAVGGVNASLIFSEVV